MSQLLPLAYSYPSKTSEDIAVSLVGRSSTSSPAALHFLFVVYFLLFLLFYFLIITPPSSQLVFCLVDFLVNFLMFMVLWLSDHRT